MEIWKDVVGYEGLYEVSTGGRVRSKAHITRIVRKGIQIDMPHPGKIMTPQARRHGYLAVCLYGRGGNKRGFKQISVHRLVAEAFLGNGDGLEVNHINEDKTDNRLENLEWVTHQQNSVAGTRRERIGAAHFGKSGKPVQQITDDGIIVGKYPSAREAQRQTGVGFGNIHSSIKYGHRAGGYYWKYTQ